MPDTFEAISQKLIENEAAIGRLAAVEKSLVEQTAEHRKKLAEALERAGQGN